MRHWRTLWPAALLLLACSDPPTRAQTDAAPPTCCGPTACTGVALAACQAVTCDPDTCECVKVHADRWARCSDGDPCTTPDVCVEGVCEAGQMVCDCRETADCKPLEDDDVCNGTLACDTVAFPFRCRLDPNTKVRCEGFTDDWCNQTACDPVSGKCVQAPTPTGTLCDNGEPCSINDTCFDGACHEGPSVCECEKDSDCWDLQDDDKCNGHLICGSDFPYRCVTKPGSAKTCDTSGDSYCQITVCKPASGECLQVSAPDGTICADVAPCTTDEVCLAGACVGSTYACECVVDSDLPSCDDGNLCTTDTCVGGVCQFSKTDPLCCDCAAVGLPGLSIAKQCDLGKFCELPSCDCASNKCDNPTLQYPDGSKCCETGDHVACQDGSACSFCIANKCYSLDEGCP